MVYFNGNLFNLDRQNSGVVDKFITHKVRACIRYNYVWGTHVGIDPHRSEGISGRTGLQVLEESRCLKSNNLINSVQHRLLVNIYNVDDQAIIELNVIANREPEPVKRSIMHLALVATFIDLRNNSLVNVVVAGP
jgi:hypothetical protein